MLFFALGLWMLGRPQVLSAATLPADFQESTVFSGLIEPTAVEFAPDGRVFVAEKSGLINVFDDIADGTPTVFADLRTNVHGFWDRGLLGLALDPGFPADPYVYVAYAHDAPIGGTAPTWGAPGMSSDGCPTPPGATADGCVISGRVSRLQASGSVMTGSEQVLIEGWCQQYPSHSVGDLAFGADGALYVSGGEGASFNFTDYGQDGNPLNPCGDPPAGVGGVQSPPTAEGGSLRSQDLRTSGDPVGLSGAILRVDRNTGAGLPGNPLFGSADLNARRIIAHGTRNPFRLTIRPGTNEIWVGDVGSNRWEEIERIPDPAGPVKNLGWPCYEGGRDTTTGASLSLRHSGWDSTGLNICENLYGQEPNAVTPPYFAYGHSESVVSGDTCPTGDSSIAGLAFGPQTGSSYPPAYRGALFFADYSRDCIWAMRAGTNGLPDPATRQAFVAGAANPVDLEIGPGGDLFYIDFTGGTIRRIKYLGTLNQPPTAVADATPRSGPVPLTVAFDGTRSSDPDPGDTLTYAWDLDGDGAYDDSTSSRPSYTYTTRGVFTIRLRVIDGSGATATDSLTISADETPPAAAIVTPSSGTTWKVGEVIEFSGTATDQQDGSLGPSALSWTLLLHHCPSVCHIHTIQSFSGVSSGSFVAPDHEYPSHLELRLTATDSAGQQDTKSVTLDPRTVALSFESGPAGLQLVVGGNSAAAPFTREVIAGSTNSVSAPAQTLNGTSYVFSSWSDGKAQSHEIVAPDTAARYAAAFAPLSKLTFAPEADARVEEAQPATNYATSYLRADGAGDPDVESYLRFQVAGVSGPVQSAKLRLWTTSATGNGPAAYSTGNGWSETGITWSNRPARTSGPTDDKRVVATGTWEEHEVKPLLSDNGAYSFIIATGSNDGIDFDSREATNAAHRPQLVVSFVDKGGYARPRGASPTTVRLVPAYAQCGSPNATHGEPLSSASCGPPAQSSDRLTVGAPDANGKSAASTGALELKVVGESPINAGNGDQADVQITTRITDVRMRSDLSDYTGELQAVLGLRITDRYHGALLDNPATAIDTPFSFVVPCAENTGPEGGVCSLTTTADALVADVVREGQRAIWELGDVKVYDGGPDGDADTADNTLFAVQGLFAP
jgi:glucose/arabinose dehydrogenase/PKD repeat protein